MSPVIVIGAGFYGLMIGSELLKMGFSVTVLEASHRLGAGASWANQARVHGGYHYPRSYLTASRSRESLKRFVGDFEDAIFDGFQMHYAIARDYSKVSAAQFEALCLRIGAPLEIATAGAGSPEWRSQTIERSYRVEEPAFDGLKLIELARAQFEALGGQIILNSRVLAVREESGGYSLETLEEVFHARAVFDVTYSSLGTVFDPARSVAAALKVETAEIALFRPPEGLEKIGVTVMDGPFFSFMPFPPEGLHSLTHVSYTPRSSRRGSEPRRIAPKISAWNRMLSDAQRFLPEIAGAEYVKSIYIDKAVLTRSEGNDSRPIYMAKSGSAGLFFSVLGAKIDNVYDALSVIRADKELQVLAS